MVVFCRKLLGNCNLQVGVLPQAIGKLKFGGWRFGASHWGIAICRVAFCCKRLGITISRVALCRKLLGNCNLEGWVLPQAIGELQFAR